MSKIMRNGVAYGKGGKIIVHNGVAYGGNHVAKLVEKTITANGTYNASADGVDGYSAVTVNIPAVAQGNLFDYTAKRTENGYRNHAGLEPSNPQTYESDMSSYAPVSYISEYIPVEAGVKYFRIIPEFTWNWPGIVVYNANKEFLSFIESAKASYQEITMPENAAYVRLSICDTTGISLTTCPDFERLCSFCRA